MQTEEAGTPGDPSQFCHLLAVSLWAGAWPLLSLCFLGGTLRRKWGRLWFSILRCAFGNRLDGRYSNPDESRSLTFNSWWPDFPYLAGNGLIGWESKTRAGAWARGAFSVLWLRWVWALWVGIGSCFMTCSLSHNMQLSHLLGWNNYLQPGLCACVPGSDCPPFLGAGTTVGGSCASYWAPGDEGCSHACVYAIPTCFILSGLVFKHAFSATSSLSLYPRAPCSALCPRVHLCPCLSPALSASKRISRSPLCHSGARVGAAVH